MLVGQSSASVRQGRALPQGRHMDTATSCTCRHQQNPDITQIRLKDISDTASQLGLHEHSRRSHQTYPGLFNTNCISHYKD